MALHLPRRHASGPDAHGSRTWVWLHQFDLDRKLANGDDPSSSRALQVRAHELLSPRFRAELIAELDCAVAKAEHPPHWHSARLPVRAPQVKAARVDLDALRQALNNQYTTSVRGLALAACLINDPTGPLYHSHPDTITELAQSAVQYMTALDPRPAAAPSSDTG